MNLGTLRNMFVLYFSDYVSWHCFRMLRVSLKCQRKKKNRKQIWGGLGVEVGWDKNIVGVFYFSFAFSKDKR